MTQIRILEDRLISQIAAGEVVERPASVVKELVENSLDAGAREVTIDLESGGKRRILVVDDGKGMGRDDSLLAFDRHATSKITTFDDLERVATLGFRGEALASIAAVARVELTTAREAGDGHRVRIEGGRVKSAEPASHPRGTRIDIASLFFNVPARRKFLKQPQTELRRCVEVVQGYALAHPRVRFTLRHQGRSLLETLPVKVGEKGLRERIGQVFGASFTQHLVAIPERFAMAGREGDREGIRGFVGDAETTRGRRLFIYVNRRLVRDRQILSRFYRAVREEWKSEAFPALFLFLELPHQDVDVNVHPQKAEVRFRFPAFLDRVEDALRAALGEARGEEVAPLGVPDRLPPTPPAWEGLGGKARPEGDSGEPWRITSEVREPGGGGAVAPTYLGGGAEVAGESERWRPAGQGFPASGGSAPRESPQEGADDRIAQTSFAPMTPRQVPLSGRSGEPRPFSLLGHYPGSLILLEGPDGLYLIDQHVAHERILYERLRQAMEAESTPSQNLLTPPILELGPAEAMRLGEMAATLEPCGFTIEPLSGHSLAIKAIPAVLSVDEAESMLLELATSSGETGSEVSTLRRKLLDALAASLACRGAVKMHHPLSPGEMERLVSELFEAEQPFACPHGRPVILRMTDAELERRFGRR